MTKETIKKTKRLPTLREKVFANDIPNKRLISKIYKGFIQLNIKKKKPGFPDVVQWVNIQLVSVDITAWHSGLRIWCCCSRVAAPAWIRSLAQEISYAKGMTKKENQPGSSHHGSAVTNPTSIHENAGLIPGLTQEG